MHSPPIFTLKKPRSLRRPIVLSAPHVGTRVPPEIEDSLQPQVSKNLEDTDWCVHELYDFCLDLGVTMIHADYSRYVVDLNRPTEGPALYTDSRQQTDVVPLQDFDGQPLYRKGAEPDATERTRRIATYYRPYHEALARELSDLRKNHQHVLLFDAHSIRRLVPTISPQAFPDLILGDRDGKSADPSLSRALLASVRSSPFEIAYNEPFKGGQITRFFGRPEDGIHALQLEMSQDIYLNPKTHSLEASKLGRLQPVLKQALLEVARALEALSLCV